MAEDPELARWRAQRMAQMQAAGGPTPSPQQVEQQRKKEEAMKEQRRIMLNQITTADAREKLANIRLVKPERAEQVESYLINAVQTGQINGKVSEEQLKQLLRNIVEQTQKRTKVTIMRRRAAFDEDDDDDDDDNL